MVAYTALLWAYPKNMLCSGITPCNRGPIWPPHFVSYNNFAECMYKLCPPPHPVKVLDKRHIIREKKVQHVSREKEILSLLNHPFFVKLYFTFQDTDNLCIPSTFPFALHVVYTVHLSSWPWQLATTVSHTVRVLTTHFDRLTSWHYFLNLADKRELPINFTDLIFPTKLSVEQM